VAKTAETLQSNGASKGAQTRQAILDAAIARFGREGYRATSVADIARDASLGGTVAYAYFADKEALFLAALDEDAAAVIHEGLSSVFEKKELPDWRQALLFTLVSAVQRHPLARRLLAGLEPEVTDRVLEIPALTELRKACAERLRAEQLAGKVRSDIDPVVIANGIVAIVLSLLMSVVQLGPEAAGPYGDDVAAVFEAALDRTPPRS
jgi:AcrR family transcriptional regulator